jgi:hypothetical protein
MRPDNSLVYSVLVITHKCAWQLARILRSRPCGANGPVWAGRYGRLWMLRAFQDVYNHQVGWSGLVG